MDMQLNLFFLEDCFKPSNGYSYLNNSLNSLLEHRTFSMKGRNEIHSVITFINTKLNSHGDRAQGLHLLKVFLPQCSDDVFIDNCVSWMQQCVRICSASRGNEILSLVYEVLGNIFQYSGMIQELTKPVSGSVIPKFLEHVHHVSSNFQARTENAAHLLCCLEFVMRNYGGSCGPHKNNIEQFLMKFIDHPDKQTIHLVSRCVAVLPLVGGSGVLNVNHKNSWEVLQKKLVLYLQETLDTLFEGIPEVQLFQSAERNGTEKLHIPVLEESDPFLRIQRLVMRFINLSCFLQELLMHELPVAKRVMPQLFINLFVRGFGVNSNTVSKHITADKLVVGCLIPQMHIAIFKLLEALITCCGQNLLEYGSLICRFVLQTLKWTSYDTHWPHGTERPYGELRKEAYNTLTLWLKVAKAGSCLEISSPDELIDLMLGDMKISHTAVTLSVAKARGRHLTKQQRKQLKLGQDNSASSSEPSWSRMKLYDETANHETCAAALRTLQWAIQTAGPFLKPTQHKMIQEELLKILLKIGRGEIFAPYGDWKCRLGLYQLLNALVLWPHCSWPPPLQFAFQLMRIGLSDPCVKVASYCSQTLNNFVRVVHPVSRPLHFQPSVDDMQEVIQLETSHKNKIFCSESMDTDKSHISPQQDTGLLQASGSTKHVHNASENRLYKKYASSVQKHMDNNILETKTMSDENLCDLDNSGVVHSNQVTSCQDKSVDSDGSSDSGMDFVTDNNKFYQQPLNVARDNCGQNDSELENQNNHNIMLHPKLPNSEDELQEKSIETVEDSHFSDLHPVTKNGTKEKHETGESNCLSEKLDISGAGAEDDDCVVVDEDEEVEAEEEEEKVEDIDENSDINELGEKTSDDCEMENVSLLHANESSVKEQVKLKISDTTVEKPVTQKVPTLPNNYSISYLYDQSSDSNDSDTKTEIFTYPVSLENNEVDQEKFEESNSLENRHTAKIGTDEHSQTCMKTENVNENKVVCDEVQPISAPQKLVNNICEEKQDGENLLKDSSENINITDDIPGPKIVPVDLCGVPDSEDSEVDVTTIPVKSEETEKEVTENSLNMEVASVSNEGTEKNEDNSDEIQKEHDVKNEESSFTEIEEAKETTTLPEETKVPTEVHRNNNGNSALEDQGDQCTSAEVEDKIVPHSNNKETDVVDKTDTVELGRDIQIEKQDKTEFSVEIPGKDLRLQDKNPGAANEQITENGTSDSSNGQETMAEIDCNSVEKEVNDLCMNSVASDTVTETENTATEDLTEPLAKKRKLESCVVETETENNCK